MDRSPLRQRKPDLDRVTYGHRFAFQQRRFKFPLQTGVDRGLVEERDRLHDLRGLDLSCRDEQLENDRALYSGRNGDRRNRFEWIGRCAVAQLVLS